MKRALKYLATSLIGMLDSGAVARGQVLITDFNFFTSNELYASWGDPSATIVTGDESYSVTATGYGSNYKSIGSAAIQGSGNTHLELDVTLSGPPAADGQLGPIISLVDADGSFHNYAWYGQTLGDHLLTAPLSSPTWVSNEGLTPGLDLDALLHMHMQLDPAQFGAAGAYTVEWKNLNLIHVASRPGDFNADGYVDGTDFLLWQRGFSVGSLNDFKANFGAAPPTGDAAQGVPEPAAAGLMLLGFAGLTLRGRCRHRA